MIKLALSDMDNTLLPFGASHVSQRVLDAITAVRAAGVQFGPATGRDTQELYRFFCGNEHAYQTGILSNGKKVMVDGELVCARYIDNAELQRLSDALQDKQGIFIVVYPAEALAHDAAYVLGGTTDEIAACERRFKFNAIRITQVPDEPIIAATVSCTGDQQRMEDLRRFAQTEAPALRLVSPVPNWFDILPVGVSKASAFDILIDALGISADEAVFFGDAENDLEIMRKTPYSVAVANATPEAAAAAHYHIGPCTADGVAEALEELSAATNEGHWPSFLA